MTDTETAKPPTSPSVPAGMPSIRIGSARLFYTHSDDLASLLEVFVLDAYRIGWIPRDSLVVDLGSGIGDFAAAASHRVGRDGIVIAVEPNPLDFNVLNTNISANELRNVVPARCILGTDGVVSQIRFKDQDFAATAVSLEKLLSFAGLTVDSARRRPLVIKLDIEGAETQVVPVFKPLLDSVRFLAIELHGTRQQVDALLEEEGFVFRRITRRRYIAHSIWFSLHHPVAAVKMFYRFRKSPNYHGLSTILGGIQISNSKDLAVGAYVRVSSHERRISKVRGL